MSWQAYVDQQLLGTGFVKEAAILGHDGSVWAASAGIGLQGNEGGTLAAAFSAPDALFSSGVVVGGTKYLCIRADDRSIYGKKGAGGIVCVKTNQSVLVGIYDENIQPGQCTTVVEKLADYLIENNY